MWVGDAVDFLKARYAEDELTAPDERARRDIDGKRRILDAYTEQLDKADVIGVLQEAEAAKGDELSPAVAGLTGESIPVIFRLKTLSWVVRVLAETYSDHPDYLEEWRL